MPAKQPLRRVLFFGCNMSRTRCTGALVEALSQHGLEVKWLNMATLRRWLGERRALAWARRAYRKLEPDLVFVFFRDLPRLLLEEFRRKTPVVLWVEEALERLDRSQREFLELGHVVAMSNPGRFPVLQEHGVENMTFLMSGYSPTFHYPMRPLRKRRDIAFIGGPGNERRTALLDCVSRHFDTEIFGANWKPWLDRYPNLRVRGPVKPRGYRRVCASSRIMLGINEVNDEPFYFSNRTWLTLGCGAFHLTHYVPHLERVFKPGLHLDWYEGVEECLRKIDYYLAKDEERERIARAGHEFAKAEHQYFHRVSSILERISAPPVPARNGHVVPPAKDRLLQPSARDLEEQDLGAGQISTSPVTD